eukprot:1190158-Prorocentrum_minimum.AAC.4
MGGDTDALKDDGWGGLDEFGSESNDGDAAGGLEHQTSGFSDFSDDDVVEAEQETPDPQSRQPDEDSVPTAPEVDAGETETELGASDEVACGVTTEEGAKAVVDDASESATPSIQESKAKDPEEISAGEFQDLIEDANAETKEPEEKRVQYAEVSGPIPFSGVGDDLNLFNAMVGPSSFSTKAGTPFGDDDGDGDDAFFAGIENAPSPVAADSHPPVPSYLPCTSANTASEAIPFEDAASGDAAWFVQPDPQPQVQAPASSVPRYGVANPFQAFQGQEDDTDLAFFSQDFTAPQQAQPAAQQNVSAPAAASVPNADQIKLQALGPANSVGYCPPAGHASYQPYTAGHAQTCTPTPSHAASAGPERRGPSMFMPVAPPAITASALPAGPAMYMPSAQPSSLGSSASSGPRSTAGRPPDMFVPAATPQAPAENSSKAPPALAGLPPAAFFLPTPQSSSLAFGACPASPQAAPTPNMFVPQPQQWSTSSNSSTAQPATFVPQPQPQIASQSASYSTPPAAAAFVPQPQTQATSQFASYCTPPSAATAVIQPQPQATSQSAFYSTPPATAVFVPHANPQATSQHASYSTPAVVA